MALEDEVFTLLESMLERGDLPYRKELTRLRRNVKYYSKSRMAYVEFENVIEVYLKDNVELDDVEPAHVVFFECKDHSRNVETRMIDEIVGRMNLSLGFNIKAYIVTRKGFAASAIATARNNGIGLIKLMPGDKVEHVLYNATHELFERLRREFPKRARQALLNADYVSYNESFYGVDNGYVFSDLSAMLDSHLAGQGLRRRRRSNG
jgi:hypothetical protein